jgi:uncharacterized protein YndB with AHSA1/START domain
VGARFRFIGKLFPGWGGIVRCEVLAVRELELLRYDWRNKETDQPTVVTDILEAAPDGTRLTWGQAPRLAGANPGPRRQPERVTAVSRRAQF